jgi:hypothetical protein
LEAVCRPGINTEVDLDYVLGPKGADGRRPAGGGCMAVQGASTFSPTIPPPSSLLKGGSRRAAAARRCVDTWSAMIFIETLCP